MLALLHFWGRVVTHSSPSGQLLMSDRSSVPAREGPERTASVPTGDHLPYMPSVGFSSFLLHCFSLLFPGTVSIKQYTIPTHVSLFSAVILAENLNNLCKLAGVKSDCSK